MWLIPAVLGAQSHPARCAEVRLIVRPTEVGVGAEYPKAVAFLHLEWGPHAEHRGAVQLWRRKQMTANTLQLDFFYLTCGQGLPGPLVVLIRLECGQSPSE